MSRIRTFIALLLLWPGCLLQAADNPPSANESGKTKQQITVLSLNIAHGRSSNGVPQYLQRKKTLRGNLDEIAKVFSRHSPDVIAIQEADGASLWSGRFNHVAYLAEKAGYTFFSHGRHVKAKRGEYGTALLSNYRLLDTESIAFERSRPTPRKGFVVSRIEIAGQDAGSSPQKITLVSVHLDFSRQGIRKRQVKQMAAHLKSINGPLIIMGDFNCDGNRRQASLTTLIEELDLQTYKPRAKKMGTFPSSGKRLDWILISKDLTFENYETLPDRVSDHLPIVATISLKPTRSASAEKKDD